MNRCLFWCRIQVRGNKYEDVRSSRKGATCPNDGAGPGLSELVEGAGGDSANLNQCRVKWGGAKVSRSETSLRDARLSIGDRSKSRLVE